MMAPCSGGLVNTVVVSAAQPDNYRSTELRHRLDGRLEMSLPSYAQNCD